MLAFTSAIIIFIFASCGLLAERWVKRRFFLWIPLALLVFALWVIWLLVPIGKQAAFIETNWFRIGALNVAFLFRGSIENWFLCFSWLTACLTILVSAPLRIYRQRDVDFWIQSAYFTSLGILAASLQTLWALAIVWVVFDTFQWLMDKFQVEPSKIISFTLPNRVVSWFLLLVSSTLSGLSNEGFLISLLPQTSFLLLLLAAYLRIFPQSEAEKPERGSSLTKFILRAAQITISFGWLWQYKTGAESFFLQATIIVLLCVSVVIIGLKSFTREMVTIQLFEFFIIAASIFFVIFKLPSAMVLILSAWVVYGAILDSSLQHFMPRILFFSIIAFLFSALPFAPLFPIFTIWQSSLVSTILPLLILIIWTYEFYILKITHTQSTIPIPGNEPWQQGLALGIITLDIFAAGIVTLKVVPVALIFTGLWWVGIPTIFASLVFFGVSQKLEFSNYGRINKVWNSMNYKLKNSTFFSSLILTLIKSISTTIEFVNAQLEGSGGILWALVILALFLSASRI